MSKTLFDHLNAIYTENNLYFDNLTEEEKKSWNNYMLQRFISMKKEYLPIVDIIQPYTEYLRPREFFLFYASILPRRKTFAKYIKPKEAKKYPKEVIEILSKQYNVSIESAEEYYDIFTNTEEGKTELKQLCLMYGVK